MTISAPSLSRRTRQLAAMALFLVVTAGVAVFLNSRRLNADTAVPEGVVQVMDGHLQYSFHLVTGTEGLFDLKADPRALRNLADERPEVTKKLRMRLLSDMNARSLDELRGAEQETIDRLRSLGYL